KNRDSYSEASDESDVSEAEVDGDSDDDNVVKSWGPDLIGDEEDRRRLNEMNDIDRESELYSRKEKVDAWKERQEVRQKLLLTEKRTGSTFSSYPDR
ncbi:hypothetical protein HK096_001512, partial [Nowakowskiella sp. JEL0078]